jgi:hypothetical protein
MEIEPILVKRRLHDPDHRSAIWASQSAAARLEAVERLRRSGADSHDPQPEFPPVYRFARKAWR